MSFPLPNGTRVRLKPSTVNDNFARATGFNPTGKTGTIMKNHLFYHVKLDEEIPLYTPEGHSVGIYDNVLCLLPDEIEVVQ